MYGWLVIGQPVGAGLAFADRPYASYICDMNSAAAAAVCGLRRYTSAFAYSTVQQLQNKLQDFQRLWQMRWRQNADRQLALHCNGRQCRRRYDRGIQERTWVFAGAEQHHSSWWHGVQRTDQSHQLYIDTNKNSSGIASSNKGGL